MSPRTLVASCLVVSFGLLSIGVQAEAQPIDPYGAPPPAAPPADPNAPPLDPYAPDPYAPRAYPAYPPLSPPPQLPQLETGCPAGCPQYRSLAYTPTPPEMERRPRYGLMAAGISVLGSVWLITMSSGLLAERNELAIPIAGPIITATDLGRGSSSWDGGRNLVIGVLVLDALVQTGGLVMAIAGGASRKLVPKRRPYQPLTVRAYGAGVSGTF